MRLLSGLLAGTSLRVAPGRRRLALTPPHESDREAAPGPRRSDLGQPAGRAEATRSPHRSRSGRCRRDDVSTPSSTSCRWQALRSRARSCSRASGPVDRRCCANRSSREITPSACSTRWGSRSRPPDPSSSCIRRRTPSRSGRSWWRCPVISSAAAFLLAAGLLVEGSVVTTRGTGVNPTRSGFDRDRETLGRRAGDRPARRVSGRASGRDHRPQHHAPRRQHRRRAGAACHRRNPDLRGAGRPHQRMHAILRRGRAARERERPDRRHRGAAQGLRRRGVGARRRVLGRGQAEPAARGSTRRQLRRSSHRDDRGGARTRGGRTHGGGRRRLHRHRASRDSSARCARSAPKSRSSRDAKAPGGRHRRPGRRRQDQRDAKGREPARIPVGGHGRDLSIGGLRGASERGSISPTPTPSAPWLRRWPSGRRSNSRARAMADSAC